MELDDDKPTNTDSHDDQHGIKQLDVTTARHTGSPRADENDEQHCTPSICGSHAGTTRNGYGKLQITPNTYQN
jgi:hypothetical protein